MFENAGLKIKKFAKLLFSLEVAGAVLGAFAFLMEEGIDLIIPAILIALGGFAVAYVTALFLVAFGDLVQSSKETKELLEKIKGSSEG